MLEHNSYQIAPNYHLFVLDSKRVVFLSENSSFLLSGEIYVAILRMLQEESLSEKSLTERLINHFSFNLIQEAVKRLKEKRFISLKVNIADACVTAFWHECGVGSIQLLKTLPTASIMIKNYSKHQTTLIENVIHSLGIQVDNQAKHALVIVDNYINGDLLEFSLQSMKLKRPWLLLKPTGRMIWLGPIFDPPRTACWQCMASKLKQNRRVEIDLFGTRDENLNLRSLAYLPTTLATALNLAVTQLAKWLLGNENHQLQDHIWTLDMGNLGSQLHPVGKSSFCPACAQMPCPSNPSQLTLSSSKKHHFYEDGARSISIDSTLSNLTNIISPLTGIVSEIKHALVHDHHICYSMRNPPVDLVTETKSLKQNIALRIPDVVVGKGRSKTQALVGCLAEAIERHNSTYVSQPRIVANFEEINDNAIHPHSLLNFSKFQYLNRNQINQLCGPFNQIPKPYDNSKIGWTKVMSLVSGRHVHLPASYCYLHYPFEREVEMCPADTNGCAGGNTLEKATLYALFELIERDAVAIWWYNRTRRPSVDLERVNSESVARTKAASKRSGRELHVIDITTDFNVPCYVAVSWDLDGSRIIFGTSAHLDPIIAISRAVAEMNQIMIRHSTPANIDLSKISIRERDLVHWILTQNIKDHPYLCPLGVDAEVNSSSLSKSSDDFLDDIHFCIKSFIDGNLDVLLLNYSNVDMNFFTVKAVVPGLRHFWSRLAPGRLYDVPVLLGWLPHALREDQLNPQPYFL